jgi:hypothetical protein
MDVITFLYFYFPDNFNTFRESFLREYTGETKPSMLLVWAIVKAFLVVWAPLMFVTVLVISRKWGIENSWTLRRGRVYLIQSGEYFKIGYTYDLRERVKTLGYLMPLGVTYIGQILTDKPQDLELY